MLGFKGGLVLFLEHNGLSLTNKKGRIIWRIKVWVISLLPKEGMCGVSFFLLIPKKYFHLIYADILCGYFFVLGPCSVASMPE